MNGLEGLDNIQTTVAHSSAEGLCVRNGLSRISLRASRLQFVEQCRSAGNEWSAEGSARTGGVSAEGIGCDDLFAGRGDPDDGVAVVGEGGALVEKVGGSDAHDVDCVGSRVDDFLKAVVAGRGYAKDVQLARVGECGGKFLGICFEIETHVDDVGVVLRGVIDGTENVGKICGPVGLESFEGKQMRFGSDEVNDSHHHGAVAECGVLRIAVEDGGGGLIENGSGRLIDMRGRGGIARGRRRSEVSELGAVGLIAREIVAGKQNGLESGMIRINAGVNVRDDADAGNLKSVLRFRDTDDLGGGLVCVAVPDGGTEIDDGSCVG